MHKLIKQTWCRVAPFWQGHEEYKKVDPWLRKIRNKYEGERLFIIGLGPSLDKTNLNLIKDEYVMATNNFYEGMKKFKVKPQFWSMNDGTLFLTHHSKLLNLDTALFLLDDAGVQYVRHGLRGKHRPVIVRKLGYMGTWDRFSTDLIHGAYGGMVIFGCLQVAYWLGFKNIYLLGCDSTFKKGVHFGGVSYEAGVSDIWDKTFELYGICKKVFEDDGRIVYNATVGGDLEVFKRIKLEDIK